MAKIKLKSDSGLAVGDILLKEIETLPPEDDRKAIGLIIYRALVSGKLNLTRTYYEYIIERAQKESIIDWIVHVYDFKAPLLQAETRMCTRLRRAVKEEVRGYSRKEYSEELQSFRERVVSIYDLTNKRMRAELMYFSSLELSEEDMSKFLYIASKCGIAETIDTLNLYIRLCEAKLIIELRAKKDIERKLGVLSSEIKDYSGTVEAVDLDSFVSALKAGVDDSLSVENLARKIIIDAVIKKMKLKPEQITYLHSIQDPIDYLVSTTTVVHDIFYQTKEIASVISQNLKRINFVEDVDLEDVSFNDTDED